MREFLFRAKRTDNGEWVPGDFTQVNGRAFITVEYTELWTVDPILGETKHTKYSYKKYEVDPATVGQYTGMADKNGMMIFEGDICIARDSEYVDTLEIKWDDRNLQIGTNLLESPSDSMPLCEYSENCLEIIGNIHDNPELLEVGE